MSVTETRQKIGRIEGVRRLTTLYNVAVIMVVLRLFGQATSNSVGRMIHVLPAFACVAIVLRIMRRQNGFGTIKTIREFNIAGINDNVSRYGPDVRPTKEKNI